MHLGRVSVQVRGYEEVRVWIEVWMRETGSGCVRLNKYTDIVWGIRGGAGRTHSKPVGGTERTHMQYQGTRGRRAVLHLDAGRVGRCPHRVLTSPLDGTRPTPGHGVAGLVLQTEHHVRVLWMTRHKDARETNTCQGHATGDSSTPHSVAVAHSRTLLSTGVRARCAPMCHHAHPPACQTPPGFAALPPGWL